MCKKKSIIFDEGVVRTRLLPVFKYVKGQNIPAEGKLAIYIQEHNSNERKASEPFLVYPRTSLAFLFHVKEHLMFYVLLIIIYTEQGIDSLVCRLDLLYIRTEDTSIKISNI